jgi:glycosyltransferase involved in cell wall biosynthesis
LASSKEISVIICTYNRSELLGEALYSLAHQTVDATCYEVIIVNNNSTDNTEEIVRHFIDTHDNFRVVTETQQGLSHARNRGYKEAAFDWVAYMDDDAKAFPNYVERILHVIENYDFDCFGGVYLPWFKNKKPKWYKNDWQTNRDLKCETGELGPDEYFTGCNCVFRKDLLVKTSGFSTEVGMTGDVTAYGEETLMVNELRKLNYKIGFDPKLKVDHYVDEYKQKVAWFFKSSYAHGRDGWKSFKTKVTFFRVVKSLGNMILLPVINLPGNFVKIFTKGYYFQNFIIDTFTPSAIAWGEFVEGIQRLLKR